jgi:hypothetical protein
LTEDGRLYFLNLAAVEAVGRYRVESDRYSVADAFCGDMGVYTWRLDGAALFLSTLDDPCNFRRRVINGRWMRVE